MIGMACDEDVTTIPELNVNEDDNQAENPGWSQVWLRAITQ